MIRVVHPGSWIRMLTFYPSRIPDPGVKKAPDPGSRIRIRNTGRNGKKISQIINAYLYLPFFLFVILWNVFDQKDG
jgi:hypothetical protein